VHAPPIVLTPLLTSSHPTSAISTPSLHDALPIFRIFDEYVGVEQFVRILIGIGFGRFGTPEVNRLLVARNDGVNRRILPRAQTLEAKLSSVVGKGAGDVQGEELRCDLTNHGQVYHRKCWVVPTAGHRFFFSSDSR